MAGLVALIQSRVSAPRTCNVFSCRRPMGLLLFSLHRRPLLFSHLPFIFTQIPTVEDFVLWYPLIEIALSAGVHRFPFLSACGAPAFFGWVLWVSISTTP
jgi:hypothetical protein